jgi:hypothetical protein
MATGYRLDDLGSRVQFQMGAGNISLQHHFLNGSGANPASYPMIQQVPGVLSPGVKQPGHEADHSPPTSAEVKNVELYLHSPIHLHDVLS